MRVMQQDALANGIMEINIHTHLMLEGSMNSSVSAPGIGIIISIPNYSIMDQPLKQKGI